MPAAQYATSMPASCKWNTCGQHGDWLRAAEAQGLRPVIHSFRLMWEVTDLVLDEGHKWRDDNGNTAMHHCRQLVTQALATACRHQPACHEQAWHIAPW